ncbi:unnamed protein product [Vicia faba]|uniref:Uncharacterized protein n=1 Tax=Vicia faba TaxID=3906 RepID=A0AAV0YKB2_VICFA|nr:unnamed protein product [Vicia faba]
MSSTPILTVDDVLSQLPNQRSSQPSQQGAGNSRLQTNVQQEVERRQRRSGQISTYHCCKDVNDKPNALRIIMEFDKYNSPIGEAAGLLAGICGLVETNILFFPIGFEKWSSIPEGYFNKQRKILFQVHEDLAKRYIEVSIGKNWKKYRLKLWNAKYDPLVSKSQIIENKPEDVNLDH